MRLLSRQHPAFAAQATALPGESGPLPGLLGQRLNEDLQPAPFLPAPRHRQLYLHVAEYARAQRTEPYPEAAAWPPARRGSLPHHTLPAHKLLPQESHHEAPLQRTYCSARRPLLPRELRKSQSKQVDEEK